MKGKGVFRFVVAMLLGVVLFPCAARAEGLDGSLRLEYGGVFLVSEALEVAGNVTVDLNGGIMVFTEPFGSVFRVPEGAALTLTDSGADVPHYYMVGSLGQYVFGTLDSAGDFVPFTASTPGVRPEPLYGGVITGGKSGQGGGILVNGGTLEMRGGTVSGNRADLCGGGVSVTEGGTFVLSAGAVVGNMTYGAGGGLYAEGGSVVLTGSARMDGNTASSAGGGVCVDQSLLELSGSASVSGNRAKNGGGIWAQNGSELRLSGGLVAGNGVSGSGGGVLVAPDDGSVLSVTGGTEIGPQESGSDLYLGEGVTVSAIAPEREGYEFRLYTDAERTEAWECAEGRVLSDDVSLYTGWEEAGAVAPVPGNAEPDTADGTDALVPEAAESGEDAMVSQPDAQGTDALVPEAAPEAGGTGAADEAAGETNSSSEAAGLYTDLNPEAWYMESVNYCIAHGLIDGDVENGRFYPDDPINSLMMITVYWHMLGSPDQGVDLPEDSAWYGNGAVRWALSSGSLTTESLDSLSALITRQQMAAFLCRYAQNEGADNGARADLSVYADWEDISDWALEEM